ncbi:hypothetical protein BaRGS_00035982 [Batillaria attramentaria]|uniref:Uncharacterized protein n=1 Tax=Batillaria attramentaria TaxID=370345 RepID=A0ABD0JD15_9CAEN
MRRDLGLVVNQTSWTLGAGVARKSPAASLTTGSQARTLTRGVTPWGLRVDPLSSLVGHSRQKTLVDCL